MPIHPRSQRCARKFLALAAGVVIGTTVLTIGRVTPVHAAAMGSDGQQAAFSPSCDSNYAFNQGDDNYGDYVYQWFYVGAAVPENGCEAGLAYDWGWWWVGWMRTDGYWDYGSGYQGTTYTNFPTSQDGDWVVVGMP